MRSLQLGVLKGYALVGLCAVALAGGGLLLAQAPANTGGPKAEQSRSVAAPPAAKPGTMWKENYAVEYTGSLPVSVAFAPDGKTLLAGDTSGEVMALIFPGDEPVYRWKARAEGSHAAVAYSADGKTVYVTTRHGVLVLDAADGKTQARIEAKDSAPTAVGVFPDKPFAETHTESKIIFGTAQGYLVKSWVDGKPETAGTIEVTTTPKGHAPADAAAVPLAVDPAGRSAICAGPRLGDRPVLWAYVCGDHAEGSPGNRVLDGHAAAVVSAAWAKDGATAATGDAAGRVIVWDAKTMKETRRLELGGRVMALALSTDGARTAAAVRTKLGSEVHVWDTATPPTPMKPIHTYFADYGSEPSASLSFSPDGKRLAGCAIDKKWAQLPKAEVRGKVRVWELAAEPKAQRPPKPAYTINLPKGSSSNFVILNNHSIVLPSSEAGGIDFRNLQDGHIQFRLGLGAFTLGGLKLSADRQWLAVEQRAIPDPKAATFEVGVYSAMPKLIATIPACGQLLDIAPGGKRVAVVRDQRIELWDPTTTKLAKAAPFKHTRIDAASFSPDGKRLALADGAELVLWRVDDDTHERIDLGRPVGSLAFSPDGKFLAEGPTPGESIRIRDVETGKVVQSLATGPKQSMTVPRLAFAQGGRLLVTADTAGPPRITLWDAATGGLAHPIALPAGVPHALDVSPNGRYLVATLEDAAGVKLTAWRLDGETPPPEAGPTPPAATPRR